MSLKHSLLFLRGTREPERFGFQGMHPVSACVGVVLSGDLSDVVLRQSCKLRASECVTNESIVSELECPNVNSITLFSSVIELTLRNVNNSRNFHNTCLTLRSGNNTQLTLSLCNNT